MVVPPDTCLTLVGDWPPPYRGAGKRRQAAGRRRRGGMHVGDLPPQLRPIMQALTAVVRSREPAIRERVEQLRAQHPDLGPEGLSRVLIRSTRSRVAATGALSGASAIA